MHLVCIFIANNILRFFSLFRAAVFTATHEIARSEERARDEEKKSSYIN